MQTCKGKTRTGAACRAPAGSGGLCFFHANPNSAKALGQIGGRKNRRSLVDLEVPDNMTAADVRNVTAQAIRLLLSGDLRAREASALAQLCNSIQRTIPTADLEARVTMLEEQVLQEESRTSSDRDSTGSPAEGTNTDAQPEDEEEQHRACSIDASARDESGAESRSDGPCEADKA
jgi:hypothetical protein